MTKCLHNFNEEWVKNVEFQPWPQRATDVINVLLLALVNRLNVQ